MTELEYVVGGFERKLSCLKDKRILVHGSREYAKAIIDRFSPSFQFVGVMSFDPIDGDTFHGLPVYPPDAFEALDVDAVVLTERVKYAETAYQSIHRQCEQRGILLYNMYGCDEIENHREIESSRELSVDEWKQACAGYQLVAFELMDTVLSNRSLMRELIPWLLESGVDVRFSLRKSFPEKPQVAALKKMKLCPDVDNRLIVRQGEDLSFRRLVEGNPDKRILYIGTGIVNECLLPRCYGIDTRRISNCPWCMPVGNEDAPREPFDSEMEERVRRSIRESDVVSFDVFDTLLIRRTLAPKDVFALLEVRQREAGEPVEGFAKERQMAEAILPHAPIDEIYQRLRVNRGWSASFAQKLQEAELALEREVLLPRTEVVELFHYALAEGKRVVLTSDMYLPASTLGALLRGCGIEGYEKLLVSCEYEKGKCSGLYDELLRLRRQGDRVLHIGDNPIADAAASEHAGISAILLPSPYDMAVAHGWQHAIQSAHTLMERCLVGMCIAELFRDPFQNPNLRDLSLADRYRRFAVSVGAPLTIGFLTWLIRELRETACDGVLFLARDGYFLWKAYQRLRLNGELPPSWYYYTSRRSAFLCCADHEDAVPYTELQGPDLLHRIYGLEESQITLQKSDETSRSYIHRHMKEITETAKNMRQGVMAYSDRTGLKRGGTYIVVDLMSYGTTQFYMESWMPYHFEGRYFGNYKMESRLTNHVVDYLRFRNDSLLSNYLEIESFFTSDEPSVWCIDPSGMVRFAKETRSAQGLEILRVEHQEAMRLVEVFFDSFYEENEAIDSWVPEELYAADGCHWLQASAYDDWQGRPMPIKRWADGGRTDTHAECGEGNGAGNQQQNPSDS